MKRLLPACVLLLSLLPVISPRAASAEESKGEEKEELLIPNGDLSNGLEGWSIIVPKEAKTQAELVPDGYDGQPAMKLEIGDLKVPKWKGRVNFRPKFEAGQGYTFRMALKCEPIDGKVEILAWGQNPDEEMPKNLVQRFVTPSQDWDVYEIHFTVDEVKEKMGVSINNLAQANMTHWVADVSLIKD